MGTPDFAVPALRSLHENNFEVSLVVTQPDRPKGRGKKVIPPPVKVAAEKFGYPVLQTDSVKTDAFYNIIKEIGPDLMVVIAFGHILTEKTLLIPGFGSINIHASLLPKYRGSAPIQWSVINGDKETGITTMLLDNGMDTGDILLTEKTPINPEDTSASLHDRLASMSGNLLLKTIKGLHDKTITPVKQNDADATYAPMLSKKDGRINWKQTADQIEPFIRGMTPWPGAFTFFNDKRLKIFKANVVATDYTEQPGTIIKGFTDELRIMTGKGALSIIELQGSSGKRLSIKDFLRGHKMPVGSIFS
ncbi:MAG: methionyl-tRNA formyltransferase [Desulfobacterales bacterium]|nr:methionyl-tRNA formyltransferase [Desulfobacterales bacterium]